MPNLLQAPLPLPLRLLPQSPLQLWQQHPANLLIPPEPSFDWQQPGRVVATAIAVKLAPVLGKTAVELAQALLVTNPVTLNLPPSLPLFADQRGWLYGIIPDVVQADWLSDLLRWPDLQIEPNLLPPRGQEPHAALLARLQYAHARCCSLLRLASADPSLATPPVWLNQQQLWLQDPAEKALLGLLLHFPASLSTDRCFRSWGESEDQGSWLAWPPEPKHLLLLIKNWVDGFEQFYRHCQIFSDVKTQQPQLALARLGLVTILQKIFVFLIEKVVNQQAYFYL
jgi:DALR anticodon binding domain